MRAVPLTKFLQANPQSGTHFRVRVWQDFHQMPGRHRQDSVSIGKEPTFTERA
jgi:hypothetical protein